MKVNREITAATTDARFLASDGDMLAAEQRYCQYEDDLACQLAAVEQDHPGYHAYHYDVQPIGHDPYVLTAILCAVKSDFSVDDPVIQQLFDNMMRPRRQYTLTVTKAVATEYAEQFAGVELDAIEPKFLDIYIKFVNYGLNCTVDSLLSRKQLVAYAGYLRSHGMRPDLFPAQQYPNVTPLRKPAIYQVADEISNDVLQRILRIANPLLGYPYVWSGDNIDTSFDCSGFVSYIMRQLGLKYYDESGNVITHLPVEGSMRRGVFHDGIYEKCLPLSADQVRPGDLVFFAGSFDASYRKHDLSHLGFYIDDTAFLACGDPCGVQYWYYDDNHPGTERPWRDFVVCHGRLPLSDKATGGRK